MVSLLCAHKFTHPTPRPPSRAFVGGNRRTRRQRGRWRSKGRWSRTRTDHGPTGRVEACHPKGGGRPAGALGRTRFGAGSGRGRASPVRGPSRAVVPGHGQGVDAGGREDLERPGRTPPSTRRRRDRPSSRKGLGTRGRESDHGLLLKRRTAGHGERCRGNQLLRGREPHLGAQAEDDRRAAVEILLRKARALRTNVSWPVRPRPTDPSEGPAGRGLRCLRCRSFGNAGWRPVWCCPSWRGRENPH